MTARRLKLGSDHHNSRCCRQQESHWVLHKHEVNMHVTRFWWTSRFLGWNLILKHNLTNSLGATACAQPKSVRHQFQQRARLRCTIHPCRNFEFCGRIHIPKRVWSATPKQFLSKLACRAFHVESHDILESFYIMLRLTIKAGYAGTVGIIAVARDDICVSRAELDFAIRLKRIRICSNVLNHCIC